MAAECRTCSRPCSTAPGVAERFASLGGFIRFESSLDARLLEATVLLLAADLRCSYEYSHHYPGALRAGVDIDALAHLDSVDADLRLAPFAPALRYARWVSRGESSPPDATRQVLDMLGEDGLVEFTVAVGYYGMLMRYINALDVQLDSGVEARTLLSDRQ